MVYMCPLSGLPKSSHQAPPTPPPTPPRSTSPVLGTGSTKAQTRGFTASDSSCDESYLNTTGINGPLSPPRRLKSGMPLRPSPSASCLDLTSMSTGGMLSPPLTPPDSPPRSRRKSPPSSPSPSIVRSFSTTSDKSRSPSAESARSEVLDTSSTPKPRVQATRGTKSSWGGLCGGVARASFDDVDREDLVGLRGRGKPRDVSLVEVDELVQVRASTQVGASIQVDSASQVRRAVEVKGLVEVQTPKARVRPLSTMEILSWNLYKSLRGDDLFREHQSAAAFFGVDVYADRGKHLMALQKFRTVKYMCGGRRNRNKALKNVPAADKGAAKKPVMDAKAGPKCEAPRALFRIRHGKSGKRIVIVAPRSVNAPPSFKPIFGVTPVTDFGPLQPSKLRDSAVLEEEVSPKAAKKELREMMRVREASLMEGVQCGLGITLE